MTELDKQSYKNHKNATPGDTVVAEDTQENTYRGTIVDTTGATVYVQANSGEMLEFRRLKNDSNHRIVLAIDGKTITDETTTKGVNSENIPLTKESVTFSFDAQITSFQTEDTTHQLG
jgi:hypothetical protein